MKLRPSKQIQITLSFASYPLTSFSPAILPAVHARYRHPHCPIAHSFGSCLCLVLDPEAVVGIVGMFGEDRVIVVVLAGCRTPGGKDWEGAEVRVGEIGSL